MSERIQDYLPHVMREHENEAPTTADLLTALRGTSRSAWSAAGSGSHRRYIPLAAAAAVTAVIGGSVWASAQLASHRSRVFAVEHVPRLACPAKYAGAAPWVPTGPAGVNAGARLVPRRVPRSAVICAYDGMNIGPQSGWKLSGRTSLRSGLAGLTAQLTWQPGRRRLGGCTLVGGRQVNYLIGLTYSGGGRLWVAATLDPNSCVGTSNGGFTSSGVIGPSVTKAFKTGNMARPKTRVMSRRRSWDRQARPGQGDGSAWRDVGADLRARRPDDLLRIRTPRRRAQRPARMAIDRLLHVCTRPVRAKLPALVLLPSRARRSRSTSTDIVPRRSTTSACSPPARGASCRSSSG
jgi:hypothetical protein